jgi:hypothetical protein
MRTCAKSPSLGRARGNHEYSARVMFEILHRDQPESGLHAAIDETGETSQKQGSMAWQDESSASDGDGAI